MKFFPWFLGSVKSVMERGSEEWRNLRRFHGEHDTRVLEFRRFTQLLVLASIDEI